MPNQLPLVLTTSLCRGRLSGLNALPTCFEQNPLPVRQDRCRTLSGNTYSPNSDPTRLRLPSITIYYRPSFHRPSFQQLVYQAWEYIRQHQLWLHVQKTESELWQDVNNQYGIAPIVETERRKQKARLEIQAVWKDSVDACLGTRTPPNPSRTLLEQLARFAKLCDHVPTAKSPSTSKSCLIGARHGTEPTELKSRSPKRA
jgi:hypothetical protein